MSIKRSSFYTKRTRVKPWGEAFEQGECSTLVELLTPEVLKSLPEPLQITNTPENCQAWIAARLSESEVLAILTPNAGALIGVIILAEFESSDTESDIHLGYLLAQKYWGKGLASEVVSGLVAHMEKAKRTVRLLGGVEISNPSSARVLQKSGFLPQPSLSDENTQMFALTI